MNPHLEQHAAEIIQARLLPGTCLEFDQNEFGISSPIDLTGTGHQWTTADRILEKIPGSAFEYYYEVLPMSSNIRFHRLDKPLTDDRRTYVSPDRRHLFTQDPAGIWHPNPENQNPVNPENPVNPV